MNIKHWKLAHGHVAGKSHIKKNIPCQDFTYTMQKDGVSLLVLADGAGYAKYSHYGAAIFAKKTANLLYTHFDEFYAQENVVGIKEYMIQELLDHLQIAKEFAGDIKEYASTLLFVAIKGEHYLAGHLGDGVIGVEKEGQLTVLSNPENGSFINSTYFVTSETAVERIRIYKGEINGITGFALMSDGSADSMFNKKAQLLAPAVKRMLEWLREHPNKKVCDIIMQNLDIVIKEETHDDCSISIASLVDRNSDEIMEKPHEYQLDFIGTHTKLPYDENMSHGKTDVSTESRTQSQSVEHDDKI